MNISNILKDIELDLNICMKGFRVCVVTNTEILPNAVLNFYALLILHSNASPILCSSTLHLNKYLKCYVPQII